LILTDGPKMALTPTYHVFDLFQVHHDAKRLPVDVGATDYEFGDQKIPAISVSASTKENGTIDISIVNTHAREAMSVAFDLDGATAKQVTGEVLTAEKLDAHNTFEKPDQLKPSAFDGARVVGDNLKVEMPPRSVVVLKLRVD
jgi:alpha-N-arabinofuranosidase